MQDILGLESCASLTNVDLSHNLLSLQYEDESRGHRQPQTESCLSPAPRNLTTHLARDTDVEAASNKGYRKATSHMPADFSTGQDAYLLTSGTSTRIQTSEAPPPDLQQLLTPEASAESGYLQCFKSLRNLSTLYLMGNPVTQQITQYRRTLLAGIKRCCAARRCTFQKY